MTIRRFDDSMDDNCSVRKLIRHDVPDPIGIFRMNGHQRPNMDNRFH